MIQKTNRCQVWSLGLLAIVLLVGLALRLFYATRANLYIDEFTTVWAAQRVLIEGLPRFPLGAIYTQGLLYTYLEAIALLLGGGFHPLVARLPSLILSVATLALTGYAAWRLFRVCPVGLAALWLALDSQAIIWGGRARTYALLQFLVLAAFLAWYAGAVVDDRAGPRWLAIGLLLVAMLDQQVTLLLLPPLAALALVARGWGWLRKPVVWLQAGVVLVAVAARWFLYRLMVLPGTTATADPRVFVDLTHPFAEWQTLAPYFTDPIRLMAVALAVGGLAWLLLRRRSPRPPWGIPILSLALVLSFVTLEVLLAAGTSWRRPRYLYPLVPLLFLGAEGVAVPALRGLAVRISFLSFRQALALLTAVFVVLTLGLAYPATRAAAMQNEWGYDRALRIVGQNWVQGDALATIAPAAAFVILGHSDYLAAEEEAQALVVERDGRRLDSWTGLPLIDSPAALAQALDTHPRLWVVVDEMRLDRHFSPEYARLLWDRFDLVAFDWGTFVFRSRPPEPPPAVDQASGVDFAGQLRLDSYALSDDHPDPGQTVVVTLRWAPITPQGEYIVSVRLINQAHETIARHDSPPLDGLYPAFRWPWLPRSQPFPDRHSLALPAGLAPGRYRLDVSLYRPDTAEPVGEGITLDFLTVGDDGLPPQPLTLSPAVRFGAAATLLSHDLVGEVGQGRSATLRLLWETGPDGFDGDYTVFVHLLDADGQIVQQWDAPPVDGWYPTSYWRPGEVVLDEHDLVLSPDLVPDSYRLIMGLYRADGTRLSLENGATSMEVAPIEVAP